MSLEKDLAAIVNKTKDAKEVVKDGRAMQRLAKNPDFNAYENLLKEAYILLIRRFRSAKPDELQQLQGALIQHEVILSIPQKILAAAEKLVELDREDQESREVGNAR